MAGVAEQAHHDPFEDQEADRRELIAREVRGEVEHPDALQVRQQRALVHPVARGSSR